MGMWIYGINTVSKVVQKRPKGVKELVLVRSKKDSAKAKSESNPKIQEIISEAKDRAIKHRYINANEVASTIKNSREINHQRVLAYIEPKSMLTLAELIKKDSKKDSIYLILDGVTDPNNLGAIIRTASSFNVRAIILPKDRSSSIRDDVYKTSGGTVEDIDICTEVNLVRVVEELKSNNFWVYGLEESAKENIDTANFTGKVCCVMGGEDSGVRNLLSKNCDSMLRIPISDNSGSLNVSVSTAIVLYELARQRKFSL